MAPLLQVQPKEALEAPVPAGVPGSAGWDRDSPITKAWALTHGHVQAGSSWELICSLQRLGLHFSPATPS